MAIETARSMDGGTLLKTICLAKNPRAAVWLQREEKGPIVTH